MLNEMRTGNDPGTSVVSLELIVASGRVGIHVIDKLCLRVLDGLGIMQRQYSRKDPYVMKWKQLESCISMCQGECKW